MTLGKDRQSGSGPVRASYRPEGTVTHRRAEAPNREQHAGANRHREGDRPDLPLSVTPVIGPPPQASYTLPV